MSGKTTSIQIGIAGEHYVMAELSRRGYIACQTLRNTRGIDILVSNTDASRSAGIQVKTTQSAHRKWMLNKKAEGSIGNHLFYVLVCLGSDFPTYHIVPSKDVATDVSESHAEWLKAPGKQGQAHKDSTIRVFRDLECKYKDRWDLLGLEK